MRATSPQTRAMSAAAARNVLAGQQAELVVQAFEDLVRRQRAYPGRGEFDGQGKAVEPAADLGHGFGVLGTQYGIRAWSFARGR